MATSKRGGAVWVETSLTHSPLGLTLRTNVWRRQYGSRLLSSSRVLPQYATSRVHDVVWAQEDARALEMVKAIESGTPIGGWAKTRIRVGRG